MQNELNIQIHNIPSWEAIRSDDAHFHYLFPMALVGKHGFQAHEIRSYQLDLRGQIEVIASPVQFFPRLRDTTTDIRQRTRINILARYFWEAVKEEFNVQKKAGGETSDLVVILQTVLWESVWEGPLSDFPEALMEAREEGLEKMTAREVVDQMHQMLTGFDGEREVDEAALRKDLDAYVDQSRSRRFKNGVQYFWETDASSGGIVMVNAELDYMTVLTGTELF